MTLYETLQLIIALVVAVFALGILFYYVRKLDKRDEALDDLKREEHIAVIHSLGYTRDE